MKYKRKMARKNLPKKYKCCGYEMTYKESYGEYVCEECGYEHYLGTYHQYATNYCPNCGQKMKQIN